MAGVAPDRQAKTDAAAERGRPQEEHSGREEPGQRPRVGRVGVFETENKGRTAETRGVRGKEDRLDPRPARRARASSRVLRARSHSKESGSRVWAAPIPTHTTGAEAPFEPFRV